jgi:type VII secretion-associated serine protease mycosin
MIWHVPFSTILAVFVALHPAVTFIDQTNDRIRDQQWHLRYLNAATAHRFTQGEGVVVAVIDTGVAEHRDLRNNLLTGASLPTNNPIDSKKDTDGHGTAMAGLVAAHGTSPGNGALGLAPKSKMLPVRYKDGRGDGRPDDVATAIDWALSRGADVITISSGSTPSSRLRAACQSAIDAGVILVASAGNSPPDYTIGFPAAIDGVVAVGASDRNGARANFSLPDKHLDILAPGTEILSTSTDHGYLQSSGTSNSTAIVAGAAALVRSRFPDLSAREVVHRLTATAVDKGAPGRDDEYGYGVLDLVAALTAEVPPPSVDTPSTDAARPSASATDASPGDGPTTGSDGPRSLIGLLTGGSLTTTLLFLGYRRHRRRSLPG